MSFLRAEQWRENFNNVVSRRNVDIGSKYETRMRVKNLILKKSGGKIWEKRGENMRKAGAAQRERSLRAECDGFHFGAWAGAENNFLEKIYSSDFLAIHRTD